MQSSEKSSGMKRKTMQDLLFFFALSIAAVFCFENADMVLGITMKPFT